MGIIAVDTALMALIVVGLSSCIEGCLVPICVKCPHDREEGRTAIAPMHGKIPAVFTMATALDAKGMFDAREAVNNMFRWNLLEAIALFPATALEATAFFDALWLIMQRDLPWSGAPLVPQLWHLLPEAIV